MRETELTRREWKDMNKSGWERIEGQQFEEERALYGRNKIVLENDQFDGPADGESALKEASWIDVNCCFFNLRYPFWHDHHVALSNSEMTELCRAAIWYTRDMEIRNTKMHGIKAVRECDDIYIEDCDIISPEFGWNVRGITMKRTRAVSEYFMMNSSDLYFEEVELDGKYSFQYIHDAVFENCTFNTKDAFWHGKNILVRNSIVKGEYLAWYSENLTFENCTIIGTQPLCYCKNLKLVNCRMIDTDLAFEKSEVEATITTSIDSIKNPKSGTIQAVSVKEIIMDDPEAEGVVECMSELNPKIPAASCKTACECQVCRS